MGNEQAQALEQLLLVKKESQIVISAWWRALRRRKHDILLHELQERLIVMQTKAATDVQKAWKRFVATKQDFNACLIQKFVRKSIRKKKQVKAALVIQREWRRYHMVIREMRARLISSFLDRHIRRRKKRSAAAVVQRAWRCCVARKELRTRQILRIHKRIARFQAEVRGMLVRSITIPGILARNRAGAIITRNLRAAASRSCLDRIIRAKKVKALAHAESLHRADLLKKRREKRVIAAFIGQTREGAARAIQRQWRIKAKSLREEAQRCLEKENAEQQAQMRLVSNAGSSFNIVKRAGHTLRSIRRVIQKSAGTPGLRPIRQSKSNSSRNHRNSYVSTWRSSVQEDPLSLSNVVYTSENSISEFDKQHLAEDPRALVTHSILKWQVRIIDHSLSGSFSFFSHIFLCGFLGAIFY